MSKKIYKGYELIKAIADGEIKEGSEFIIKGGEFNDFDAFYKNDEIRTDLFGKEYKLTTKDFTESEFKLIEDNTIDIDNIKERNISYVLCDLDIENKGFKDILNKFFRENNNYIDSILQAVKQLNKEIKSIKEKTDD